MTRRSGVGKTALAVHVAHQLLDKFPGGQLYADLHGYSDGQDPAEPSEVLALFLRSLGVSAEDVPASVDERSGLLRQVLASRRVLMVLDHARTEAQVRPLLPGAGRSLVLVTSRSLLPGLDVNERISLDVLAEDKAVAMLSGLAGTARAEADPAAVARLAELCGRLPLAPQIAGQLLGAHPTWQLGRFQEAITSCQHSLGIRREFGDRYGEGRALNSLGTAYQQLGRFEEAIASCQQAVAVSREAVDRRGEGMALHNLGSIYQEITQLKKAIACYQQDIAICRETGDRYGLGETLAHLGTAYKEMRRPNQAALCWREAAAAKRDDGDHKEAAFPEQLAANAQSRRHRWWRGTSR